MPDGPPTAPPRRRVSRRAFLRLALGAAGAGLLAPVYATQVEPAWIDVTRLDLPLPGLPAALDGLAVAHLSDLHAGPYVGPERVRRSVRLANALAPDLAVLTGDFVYGSADHATACAGELAALRAPLGAYAVLGNHDVWTGADRVAAALTAAGIRVLRDEALAIAAGGAELWLVGIEDTGYAGTDWGDFQSFWRPSAGRLARLLEGIPAAAACLLLVHNPDFSEMLPPGRVGAALCGHTHGGQVRLPFLGPPIVPSCFGQKYAGGLVAGPRTAAYVSRGVGLIPPAVRFNCRPEVALLRLR